MHTRHTGRQTQVFKYIHTYIHTYRQTDRQTEIRPSIHPSVRPSVHACMHTCIHVCLQAYVQTCIHTHASSRCTSLTGKYGQYAACVACVSIHGYIHLHSQPCANMRTAESKPQIWGLSREEAPEWFRRQGVGLRPQSLRNNRQGRRSS